MIFVAIENPARVLGVRTGPAETPGLIRNKQDLRALKNPVASVDHPYCERQEFLLKESGVPKGRSNWVEDLIVDARENRLAALDVINKARIRGDVRVAMGHSLRGILGTLPVHSQNSQGEKFHTLVFYGHGNDTGLNLGLGRFPLPDFSATQPNNARLALGADIQNEGSDTHSLNRIMQLSLHNTDLWALGFASIADHVRAHPTSKGEARLHVYMMGCETGNGSFPRTAVDTLYQILGSVASVCVASPTCEIDTGDLLKLVTNIDEANEALAAVPPSSDKALTLYDELPVNIATSA